MAALNPAQLELANSLSQEDLPTKLRCAICSKLAIDAFRLPCCETAICENCQSTLPSSCPVCEHSPVSGADCTVYKSLRTTIRVFLKTEEKRREAAKPKPGNEPAPATPVESASTPIQAHPPNEAPAVDSVANAADGNPVPTGTEAEVPQGNTDAANGAALSENNTTQADEPESQNGQHSEPDGQDEGSKALAVTQNEGEIANADESAENDDGDGQHAQAGMEQGHDQANGGFDGANMNYSGDMNQMQMMMAMQNGMNPAAFGGSFPMMGMDMSMMNPMMASNMYMNGGFGMQGMGMSGMNMNMGMNGYNGFNGSSNDWSGQQSWNVGQDNFNPNAPGMGNGDFNAGFRTGNYGHHAQYNDYRRGNFGFRGRGRGRGFHGGGYGRGGYQQGYGNANDYNNWNGQANQGYAASQHNTDAQDSDSRKMDEPGSAVDADPSQNGQLDLGNDGSDMAVKEPGRVHENTSQKAGEANYNGDIPPGNQFNALQGTDSTAPSQAAPVTQAPLNAPTGPKAMRQGLPNTSLHHLKARGLMSREERGDRSPSTATNGPIVASPMEHLPESRDSSVKPREDQDPGHRESRRDTGRDDNGRGRHHDSERDRSKSYSLSRSRSRTRKESRRHRRHRSASMSDNGRDDDYRRRKHKSKRKSTREDDDHKGRSRESRHDRDRSASPGERDYKRSSHRSRRDHDAKRRDREREKDRESDYGRHRKSGHRSHRDRDYDKERDSDRARDRRGRDDEYRHRSKKVSSSTPLTPTDSSDRNFQPPAAAPRGSLSIKGAAKPGSSRREGDTSRRPSQTSAAGQTKDTHTLEREKRDRERLMKEAQRIAGMASAAGVKRSRDGGDDRGGRRKSRRSEAVNADDEEARMRRLEEERESGRWG